MLKYDKESNKLRFNLGKIKISITLSLGRFFVKYFLFLVQLLDLLLPKCKTRMVFESVPDYSDNPFVFYKYMKEKFPHKYNYVWIINSWLKEDLNGDKSYNVYSLTGLFKILTSKYIISTHSDRIIDYLVSKRHVVVNLWHGMPLKTLGLNEKHINKNVLNRYILLGKRAHFFATSDIFKISLQSCFGTDYQKIHITGEPRCDIIFDNSNNEKIEKMFNFSKFDKVIFYMPTYKFQLVRENHQVDTKYENIFYMNDYNNKKFTDFIEKNNILFIMKPHPFDEYFYQEVVGDTLPKSNNFRILYADELKQNHIYTYELFKFVDLMISDFSSVTLDFLILNRPCIYLDNLSDEYSKNRGFILPDSYKIFMPGSAVKSYSELEKEIISNLENDPYREQRNKAIQLIHKYTDNNSCERVYEIIKDL